MRRKVRAIRKARKYLTIPKKHISRSGDIIKIPRRYLQSDKYYTLPRGTKLPKEATINMPATLGVGLGTGFVGSLGAEFVSSGVREYVKRRKSKKRHTTRR